MNKESINYSFIIPHHNSPSLLQRCINSIPQRADIEIVVVDDNSDESNRPSLNRDDIKYYFITKEASKGAGKARNIGIETAKGRWLIFADCDDFYETGFINILDNFLDKNIDIIYFDAHFDYDVKNGTERKSPLEIPYKNFLNNPKSKENRDRVMHTCNSPWYKMVNHEFVNRINARFHEVPVCNDGWFSHYIAVNAENIAVIPNKLYYWVSNENSITHKINYQKEICRLEENIVIRDFMRSNGIYLFKKHFWTGFFKACKQLGYYKAICLLFLRFYYFNIK